MAGYQDALKQHNVPLELMANPDAQNGSVEAFVCGNGRVAAHLMQSLIHSGTRIPEDVRIVGIDDSNFASLLPIPLTTLRQPFHEIGEAALQTMLDRIDRPKSHAREILLDGQVIVRQS
jgi:GntR family transcriptional regulator of arabinose operon